VVNVNEHQFQVKYKKNQKNDAFHTPPFNEKSMKKYKIRSGKRKKIQLFNYNRSHWISSRENIQNFSSLLYHPSTTQH
jgi:hypothetical protein